MATKLRTLLIWTVTTILTLAFIGSGASKFAQPDFWAQEFARWGYPAAFAFLVGAFEVAGALALLHPRSAPYAAALLLTLMAGAVTTHLVTPGEAGRAGFPLFLLALAAVVGWARRPDWVRTRFHRAPAPAGGGAR